MPSINVRYFAMLRERVQKESESLSFEGTYGELYENLSHKYNFGLPVNMVQVAVNDEFTSMQNLVEHNANVVFIPPVAGG